MTDYIGGSSTLRIEIINESTNEIITYTTPAIPARKWLSTSEALMQAGFIQESDDKFKSVVEKGQEGKFDDLCRLSDELARGGKKEGVKMAERSAHRSEGEKMSRKGV
jgi:hypothetical protein